MSGARTRWAEAFATRHERVLLQFVAVLQGEAHFTFEVQVQSRQPPAKNPDLRKRPVIVKAGTVIFFMGSRYAHAVTTVGRCLRVTGWVCAAGARVEDGSGAVAPDGRRL